MDNQRYAVLGDIHSNLEALEVVLRDAEEQDVNSYICVGDVVGYNGNPSECLDRIRDLGCVCVRGNHDHYCSNDESLDDFQPLAANVIDWTRNQLSGDQLQFLRDLKYVRTVKGFTIVHSTLDMPEKWGYVFDGLEAEANFNYQITSVCFHGHTHVPIAFEKRGKVVKKKYTNLEISLGRKYFINVGSVGQPRDGDPRASYAVYDVDAKTVELRRIPYDVEKTQDRIRKVGLPERLAKRLGIGR